MSYSNYNTSLTTSYKCGFIHSAYFGNNEVVRVQVDSYAYSIQVKSIRAAKLMITKHYGKRFNSIKTNKTAYLRRQYTNV